MLVADLVPRRLEFQALLHDATESCVGDIPKPFKSPEMRKVEDVLMARIWEKFGLPECNEEDYKSIKRADVQALCAEADLIGPPGLVEDGIANGWYKHNDGVVGRLRNYLAKYKVGAWGIEEGEVAHNDFMSRARHCLEYQRALKNGEVVHLSEISTGTTSDNSIFHD